MVGSTKYPTLHGENFVKFQMVNKKSDCLGSPDGTNE